MNAGEMIAGSADLDADLWRNKSHDAVEMCGSSASDNHTRDISNFHFYIQCHAESLRDSAAQGSALRLTWSETRAKNRVQ